MSPSYIYEPWMFTLAGAFSTDIRLNIRLDILLDTYLDIRLDIGKITDVGVELSV